MSIRDSIKKQISQNGLYGRAIIGQDYLYKLEMAKLQKAQIITLGSSRVMTFRKEFFKDDISFYNVGGAMPMIADGIAFIEELTLTYHPQIIIIGVDAWWLNPNFYDKAQIRRELIDGNEYEQRKYLYAALFSFLTKEVMAFRIPQIFDKNWSTSIDNVEGRQTIGLSAASKSDGFRLDGSYQYGQYISGKIEYDKDFQDTLDRINKGTRRFQFARDIDMERLEKLENLINILKNKGIQVVLFLPPFANKIYLTMNNSPNHSEFINKFEQSIEALSRKMDIPFFNYSDILSVGAQDTETVDGFHGSDVSYARMLLNMSERNQLVESIVDQERLKLYLSNNPNPKGFIFKNME